MNAARSCDVVVVGAGPAGATAARLLALAGRSVILLERTRMPRDKPCGGCLNARTLDLLHRLVPASVFQDSRPVALDALELWTGGRQLRVPLPGGAAVRRSDLDAGLLAAARAAGVTVVEGVRIAAPGGRVLTDRIDVRAAGSQAAWRARALVVATGLAGLPDATGREWVGRHARLGAGAIVEGAGALVPGGVVRMALGRSGYAGLVRLTGDRLDVAAALDPAAVRRAGGIGPAVAAVLSSAGLTPVPGLQGAAWQGTPLMSRRPGAVAGTRWFRIGDAAGFAEPFSGEGLAWALESAARVVPHVLAAVERWDARIAGAWIAEHARTVAARQATSRALAALLRRPALARATVRLLARAPGIAAPLLARLNAPVVGLA